MLFKLHKLKCDNGHYTNAVVAEGETLEENKTFEKSFKVSIDKPLDGLNEMFGKLQII